MKRSWSTIRRAVGLAAILALAAWVRVDNFPAVIGRGELAPQLDGDSSYHLYRILATVARFPRVPHFDPLMNWPKGAFCPWADGFDLSAAGFALLAGGKDDPLRERIAIALWPVILGVVMVWVTLSLVRRVAPEPGAAGAAFAAGIAAALLPDAVNHSRFGRIDHHVVEALIVALLATWVAGTFGRRRSVTHPRPIGFEVEGALVAGLAVWSFSGSPIYVAVATLPLAWSAYARGRIVGSGGPGLAAGGLLSAALSIPAVLDHGRVLSFKYPSLLQPALLALAGSMLAGLAWVGGATGAARRRRVVTLAAILVGSAAAGAAMVAAAWGEVHGAIAGWLLRRDPWLATVGEFRPLIGFRRDGTLDLTTAYWSLGWAGYLAPLAALTLAATGWRRPRIRVLVFFTAALLALSLVQTRFSRVSVPLVAACVALAVGLACRRLARRWRWAAATPLVPALLFVTFVVDAPTRVLLFPTRAVRPEPILEIAFDLRDRPLPPALARGVLSNWSYGHQLQVQAGVPVVVNGFGSYLDETEFWKAVNVFRGSPEGLDAYLEAQRVGAVVAGAATLGAEVTGAAGAEAFLHGGLNQAYMTSVPLSPLVIAGSGVPGWNVPHLPHLMPRYASSGFVTGLAFKLPFVWSFERVRGATVRGRAAPGERVVAELRFVEHGRPHTYKAWTDPAPDGTWALVLPFPSGVLHPGLASDPRWAVAAGGGAPVPFSLDEAAVRGGAELDLGPLPARAAALSRAPGKP